MALHFKFVSIFWCTGRNNFSHYSHYICIHTVVQRGESVAVAAILISRSESSLFLLFLPLCSDAQCVYVLDHLGANAAV